MDINQINSSDERHSSDKKKNSECKNSTRIIDFSIGKPIEWAGLLYILI